MPGRNQCINANKKELFLFKREVKNISHKQANKGCLTGPFSKGPSF